MRCGAGAVFLDTVSCAKAQRLRGIIGRFDTIKPNRMELEALTGLPADTQAGLRRCCDALLQKGVRRLFVSLGADGLYYQDAGGCVIHKASRPFPVVNATGAGDAAMARRGVCGLARLFARTHGGICHWLLAVRHFFQRHDSRGYFPRAV